ncbi:MAG: A/G-specific adenine glycosylase, partial [Flavobacteriaceae bacterium]|nr:A/G-specific adenine glycosylase [Flavobacteriaceae bacterium]
YAVWISEIMLQQTRVDQALSYYQRFMQRFPDVNSLAAAPESDVLKLWQGLGYYSRARNLRKAALIIRDEFSGQFPTNYKALKQLPGIGDYTASAIASFCFHEQTPVLDGNVYRWLFRCFGIEAIPGTTAAIQAAKSQLHELIKKAPPAEFNQAIMEFGALQCSPKQPNCEACVLKSMCAAFTKDKVEVLPMKKKTLIKKHWPVTYLIYTDGENFRWQQNAHDGIWQGLYTFPILNGLLEDDFSLARLKQITKLPIETVLLFYPKPVVHILSHRRIEAQFALINYENELFMKALKHAQSLPMPVLMQRFLSDLEQKI